MNLIPVGWVIWVINVDYSEHAEAMVSMLFQEWAADPHFYEQLIEGDYKASCVFKKYKALMDLE